MTDRDDEMDDVPEIVERYDLAALAGDHALMQAIYDSATPEQRGWLDSYDHGAACALTTDPAAARA